MKVADCVVVRTRKDNGYIVEHEYAADEGEYLIATISETQILSIEAVGRNVFNTRLVASFRVWDYFELRYKDVE